jgi:hypothetical protein
VAEKSAFISSLRLSFTSAARTTCARKQQRFLDLQLPGKERVRTRARAKSRRNARHGTKHFPPRSAKRFPIQVFTAVFLVLVRLKASGVRGQNSVIFLAWQRND